MGGAWFIARTTPMRIGVLILGLASVGTYFVMGTPDLGDRPLDGRLAEIEARMTSAPESVTAEQFMALQQDLARRSPNDPVPFQEIGNLYFANGRMEEALDAYRTALRRDESFAPAADAISEIQFLATGEVDRATQAQLPRIMRKAQQDPQSLTSVQLLALINERLKAEPDDAVSYRMMGEIYAGANHLERADAAFAKAIELAPAEQSTIKTWADARFKATQTIDATTSDLYNRAYRIDTKDLRIGYMAGIGLWLQGKKSEAEAIWADINARAPANGPELQMFAAMRQMFGIDQPPAGAAGNSPE